MEAAVSTNRLSCAKVSREGCATDRLAKEIRVHAALVDQEDLGGAGDKLGENIRLHGTLLWSAWAATKSRLGFSALQQAEG